MTCMVCQRKLSETETKVDFHCVVQMEDDESNITSILVFKRLLQIDIQDTTDDDTEAIIEEHLVGKNWKIDYNTKNENDAVAVKLTVIN